jgi:hypothetical protein
VDAAIALLAALVVAATPAVGAAARFDGARAFRDLADVAALGPRVTGSDAARRARTLIAERLRQAGVVAQEDGFDGDGVNVIGERPAMGDAIVLVASHYDSRAPGPAANQAASGAALLLELARALAGETLEARVWFVFFDGHESGFRGSRALASRMEREETLRQVRALIVVARVGDTDLRLETSVLASSALRARAFRLASALPTPLVFEPRTSAHFDGDHLAFVRKGVREVLPLVDLHYGPGESPGSWTHTAGDDTRRVSAARLQDAGELVRGLVLDLAR